MPSGFAIRALNYNIQLLPLCEGNMTVCSLRSILPVEGPRQVFSPYYQAHRFYMNFFSNSSDLLFAVITDNLCIVSSHRINKSYKTMHFS